MLIAREELKVILHVTLEIPRLRSQ